MLRLDVSGPEPGRRLPAGVPTEIRAAIEAASAAGGLPEDARLTAATSYRHSDALAGPEGGPAYTVWIAWSRTQEPGPTELLEVTVRGRRAELRAERWEGMLGSAWGVAKQLGLP